MTGKSDSIAQGPGHALERMIFFSDAVFAIAITLLVIEIHVPEIHGPAGDREFILALFPLASSFMGFFISFFVIGAFWAGHHRAFDCARHWDPKLFGPNLIMLSTIAALPFFTAFASHYWLLRVPTALYCAWLLVIALCNIRLQRIVTAPPVVGSHVPADQIAAVRRRGLAVALGAATAFVVSLIVPAAGQAALMSIPLWRMLLTRMSVPR